MRDTKEIVASLAYWRGVLARLDSSKVGTCRRCGSFKVKDISEVFYLDTYGGEYEVVKYLFRECLVCDLHWEDEASQGE